MKLYFIISLILFATTNQSHSWELFKNWGIYKNESELAQFLSTQVTLFPSRVTEESINIVVTQLDNHSTTSNLDRSVVIKYLIDNIDSEIYQYQLIKKQGAKYSEGISFLGYSAAFALMSGICAYFHLMYGQKKKEIEDQLHKLGAMGILSGGGFASTYAPIDADEKEIKYHLRRLASMSEMRPFFGCLFSGLGALICGVAGINNLLDNKYADYYESQLCSIKQMLESKLESLES